MSAGPEGSHNWLLVSGLHPETTEAHLFQKFSNVGPVTAVRLYEEDNIYNGRSFVQFKKSLDVTRAVDSMQSEVLNGWPMDVERSKEDPSLCDPISGKIFIKNLDITVDNQDLFEMFSSFGKILSCKVSTDDSENCIGYGFVNFKNEESAKDAIVKANGIYLKGKETHIEKFIPYHKRDGENSNTRIIINNFGDETTNETLCDLCEPYGKILSCKVMRDENKKSKGYGFCCFARSEDAKDAVEYLNGIEMNGHKLSISLVKPSVKCESFTNVFIKNFGDDMTDEILQNLFESYGGIISCKVMCDENGKCKGFGFCNYAHPDYAQNAIKGLNGKEIKDRKLFVGRAITSNDRQKKLNEVEKEKKIDGVSLFIKNLDQDIDDQRLAEEFSSYGTVISAKVLTENGNSKGVGFVCLRSPEKAVKAVIEMDGRILGSKSIRVSLANKKEDRRPQLTSQQMLPVRPAQPDIGFIPSPSRIRPLRSLPFDRPQFAAIQRGTSQLQMRSTFQSAQLSHPSRGFPIQRADHVRTAPILPSQNQFSSISGSGSFHSTIETRFDGAATCFQKDLLEEKLLPLVQAIRSKDAKKITKTIVEIDDVKLLHHWLTSSKALKNRIDQALAVIETRQAKKSNVKKQQDNPGKGTKAEKPLNAFDKSKGKLNCNMAQGSLRKYGIGQICITNFDKTIDNKAIFDMFSEFGNILSCKVIAAKGSGNSKGFVHFETKEAANDAIKKRNGMLLNGKKVYVGKVHPPPKQCDRNKSSKA